MQRLLIGVGLILLILGLAWPWIERLGLGHLPGDIIIERGNFRFYAPLATMLLLSVIISVVLWLWRR